MFKNDIIPPAEATPASSNTKKCVSALKTALKHRETPFIRKTSDLPDLESTSNASEIKSGITLKRVYNIEKAEVVNPNPKFLNKEKNKEKSKVLDKKYHSQTDAHNRREAKRAQKKKELSNAQAKRRPKPKPTVPKINEQLNKQKKREIAEKALSERKQCLPEKTVLPPVNKKSLEQRLTTKIWQILSRDMFLLDHEQFNNQIQATNSETKKYIISVIKRCNNKELKKLGPTSTLTQTTKESKMKVAIKCALRRRLWAVTKASIKHSKHWSQFLAENNIILENINIDKFDLSLIDLEALGIENKVLKRTLTWLFK